MVACSTLPTSGLFDYIIQNHHIWNMKVYTVNNRILMYYIQELDGDEPFMSTTVCFCPLSMNGLSKCLSFPSHIGPSYKKQMFFHVVRELFWMMN